MVLFLSSVFPSFFISSSYISCSGPPVLPYPACTWGSTVEIHNKGEPRETQCLLFLLLDSAAAAPPPRCISRQAISPQADLSKHSLGPRTAWQVTDPSQACCTAQSNRGAGIARLASWADGKAIYSESLMFDNVERDELVVIGEFEL